jgi:outer membrane lipoprotein-sorting protein
MAEFKFSCPLCNQRIQCDAGYAGAQINCPSCQQSIVVPQAPRFAAAPPAAAPRPAYEAPPPPPPPAAAPGLATKQSTTVPATGRRFAGAPGAQPPAKAKSKALRNVLIITASIVVLAGLGAGGWFGFSKFKAHQAAQAAKKANPAAKVATPTANAAMQALGVLTKVRSAYTNITSVTGDSTVTLFLDLSNLTMADVNPNAPANARNANTARNATRRPPGVPRTFEFRADLSVKTAHTNWYYLAGAMMIKQDRQAQTNTFAYWSVGSGTFVFQDSHQRMVPATYMQMPDATATAASSATEQIRNFQHVFEDPAQLTKIVKDLGQTEDEPVNGQDCYTLTAKVLGQKLKIWVNKSTYLIDQSEITLGGAISDADIDDVFSLVAAGITNVPPQQLDMIKAQLKPYAPAMTKIRGTITSNSKNVQLNPTLTADDFVYAVPKGVRLTQMPGAATPARPAPRPAPRPATPPTAPAKAN